MLNPKIIENPEKIKTLLRQPIVIIENALDEAFAENLYTQLLETNNWQQQSTENDLNPEYPSDYSYARKHIDAGTYSTIHTEYNGSPTTDDDAGNDADR